jgi:hypothetical protein
VGNRRLLQRPDRRLYDSAAFAAERASNQSARAVFVATENEELVIGFVAGHLTKSFDCDAELQWINVIAEKRGQGIAALPIQPSQYGSSNRMRSECASIPMSQRERSMQG